MMTKTKKGKNKLDHKFIIKEYVNKERSTFDIAQELGTYPNTVRRILIKNGVEIRNHSQAQKNQIKKKGHPMQGKVRSQAEKDRISDGMMGYWDGMTKKEQKAESKRRSKMAKEQWEGMSDAEKEERISMMHKANYKTTTQGSKNENKVAELLTDAGQLIAQRTNDYTPGSQFEIDICLPNENVAIEIDGVTHFSNIYGADRLKKVKKQDSNKNAILLNNGFTVIRVRDNTTKHSRAVCVRVVTKILDILADPNSRNKLHYLNMK